MQKRFTLVFDEVMVKQLKKVAKNQNIKHILTKFFDKLELLGPDAGNLLDPQLAMYEIKSKHPPVRLYYKHKKETDEIYVFEFEMKTSEEKQKKTIGKLRHKATDLEP